MKKIIIFLLFIFLAQAKCFAAEQININTATLEQLDGLTGIGPTYAQRIIDGRPYSSVDDLDKVKGIGPATLQKIKDQGLACVNCQTTTETQNIPVAVITPAPAIIYPGGIIINEILPNPEGADETEEWIEIYNQNNFDVDLSGWQLQDAIGGVTTYVFVKDTKILANGFLVFKRPDTKIALNNTGDTLNFYSPDKSLVDFVSFQNAPLKQSYNRVGTGWQWSQTPTAGNKNIIFTGAKTPSTGSGPNGLPKLENSDKNNVDEVGLANLTQNIDFDQEYKTLKNPWFLFFVVLGLALVSASVILFIKLKFKKHVRT